MNRTGIEWMNHTIHSPLPRNQLNSIVQHRHDSGSESRMNDDYIAGFFDGEGSAMILTIRRVQKTGVLFRFRPVVRIAQKHPAVLDKIRDHLGFGHVTRSDKRTSGYVCNGMDNVEQFIKRIMPLVSIKGRMLASLQELIDFQRAHGSNVPYSREDVMCQLRLRDALFALNSQNRDNLVQKYPADVVMRDHRFTDIEDWNQKRSRNGVKALNEYAKSRKIRRIERVCACGCGRPFLTPDDRGRFHQYIRGHNGRKNTEEEII